MVCVVMKGAAQGRHTCGMSNMDACNGAGMPYIPMVYTVYYGDPNLARGATVWSILVIAY